MARSSPIRTATDVSCACLTRAPFQILVLPYRRSAGLEVAAFHRVDYDAWQFISGGGEDTETPEAAARREGFEEAGVPTTLAYERLDSMAMLPASWFAAWAEWPNAVRVVPEHTFAVDVGDRAIAISDEHLEVRWLHYDDAIALLRFDSNKIALWELHERLYPAPRIKRPAFDMSHAACPCSRAPP